MGNHGIRPAAPSARGRERPAHGFALLWVLAVVAIFVTIAAVAAPYLAQGYDTARYSATAATLRNIGAGVAKFEAAVQNGQKTSVHNYPGALSQLANAVSTGDVNSCEGAMTIAPPNKGTSDSLSWIAAGPFVGFMIPPGGLETPLGEIRDSVPYRGPTPGTNPFYAEIPGVSAEDADGFDLFVDNGTGDTVTIVHAAVNDTTTVRVRLLSSGQVVSGIC